MGGGQEQSASASALGTLGRRALPESGWSRVALGGGSSGLAACRLAASAEQADGHPSPSPSWPGGKKKQGKPDTLFYLLTPKLFGDGHGGRAGGASRRCRGTRERRHLLTLGYSHAQTRKSHQSGSKSRNVVQLVQSLCCVAIHINGAIS